MLGADQAVTIADGDSARWKYSTAFGRAHRGHGG